MLVDITVIKFQFNPGVGYKDISLIVVAHKTLTKIPKLNKGHNSCKYGQKLSALLVDITMNIHVKFHQIRWFRRCSLKQEGQDGPISLT